VTIADPIRGFQGWRNRWWDRADELPFPNWQDVAGAQPALLSPDARGGG
jgi:hypothetical protein